MASGERAGARAGRTTADEGQKLRAMFFHMLARAAGSGNSGSNRNSPIGRRTPSGERQRFDLYYQAHDLLTADLRDSRGHSGTDTAGNPLFRHIDDAVASLYPELAEHEAAEWRAIVCEEVEKLIRDRVMPDIDRRLSSARSSGDDPRSFVPASGILEEVGNRLAAALCDDPDLGTVLSRALNERLRELPTGAEGQRLIGVREAETILESMAA